MFDFDGVICDSEPLHDRALAAAVRAEGWHYQAGDGPGSDTHRFVGLGDRAAFAILAQEAGVTMDPPLLDRLITAKSERFAQFAAESPPEPFPGVIELICSLAAAVPVGLCTASRRIEIEPIIERFGLDRVFSSVVTREDVRETKPDPEPYALSVDRLGGDPSCSLAVEDSPTGLASAKAAGLTTIGVGSSRSREELAVADRYVRKIAELEHSAVLELAQSRA